MVIGDYKQFLDKLLIGIKEKGIDLSNFDLDHIGFQASSNEDYDKLIPEFLKIGDRVSENIVGGRRVSVFKLFKKLAYENYQIPALELIAPKEGQIAPSALEHAEFVIDTDLASFTNKYPDVDWDLSSINQPTFPMVKLKLSGYTQVKFHLQPVLEIVAQEKMQG